MIKFNANDDFPVSQPGAGLTSPLVSLGGIQTSPEPGPSSASPPTDSPSTHEPPLPPSSVQTPERNMNETEEMMNEETKRNNAMLGDWEKDFDSYLDDEEEEFDG